MLYKVYILSHSIFFASALKFFPSIVFCSSFKVESARRLFVVVAHRSVGWEVQECSDDDFRDQGRGSETGLSKMAPKRSPTLGNGGGNGKGEISSILDGLDGLDGI